LAIASATRALISSPQQVGRFEIVDGADGEKAGNQREQNAPALA